MGPHPAVAQVRLAVRVALAGLGADTAVFVACSGGADSLALAVATAFEAARTGRAAGALVVDHGLQSGSADQSRRAANLCYEFGLDPVEIIPVEVGTDGVPEGAARHARYRALDQGRGGAPVLLGHTRDDQAETVLLGLGRGSGPRSIAGMRARDGGYLRPFLSVDRATTVAACRALDLPLWDDPHNQDPRYRRVRLRREVLPLLEDVLGGGAAAALARTANLLRSDLDALDEIAADLARVAIVGPAVEISAISGQPGALRTRVLRQWAAGEGVPALSAVHLDELDALVVAWTGQRGVDLPGGFCASRRSGRLHLQARSS